MDDILILGATGSIGTTALDAARKGIIRGRIAGLVSYSSDLSSLADEFSCPAFNARGKTRDEIAEFIRGVSPSIALNGVSGTAGLIYTDILIGCGIDIALANKESIVLGGSLIMDKARERGVRIIPVDSEHSAIYHLLKGRRADSIILTASGGPFYGREDLAGVTAAEALRHPTWKMGRKITIDSATLANKGLEVIEASHLFSIDAGRIEVVIHRQSIVHSAIRTADGAVYALLSPPDMTLPIAMAIEPDLSRQAVAPLSLKDLTLTFSSPDAVHFPLLGLAYRALEMKGSASIYYCAADEAAAEAFLDGRIGFTDIPSVVARTMEGCPASLPDSVDGILEEAGRAKSIAEDICSRP